ncbi:6,7-dimethyl-8-ribityllumazine synthase [Candidatus Uhrbacteria bacterium]|nr:6,7-dimethyl-8-ribityllumazine synthase [Candidatus Uhrbacteria bacterium]
MVDVDILGMQEAKKGEFEIFDARSFHVGIVVAQFNWDVCEKLLVNAQQMASVYTIPSEHIDVVTVAGSIEIPLALQFLAETEKYDVLLALGCVMRGETPHFDYVCKIASEGILRVSLDFSIPVGFGILTCNNFEQAHARLDAGGAALRAALHSKKFMQAFIERM